MIVYDCNISQINIYIVLDSEFTLSKDIKDVGLSGNEIVPQFLLDHFIAMASSIQAGWTNNKMAQYYADCLPAVALTLGPSSWPFIKIAYKYLSMDIQVFKYIRLGYLGQGRQNVLYLDVFW